MRLVSAGRRIGAGLAVALVAINLAAYRQAWHFTHFGPPGPRVRLHRLSFAEKAEAVVKGVPVPRPENRRTPGDVGLAFERHVFPGGRGVPLEAWLIPREGSRGTVVLFHGHARSKDVLLPEARALHDMGLSTLLVDFHGSGGSGGDETSIGFHEALDVTKAFEFARDRPGSGAVVLHGVSMGAAAVLKAVADDGLEPAGLVLESPFHSLIGTVRHRFAAQGVPSFPLADLLVFWGGVQAGFNGFAFEPVESAARVRTPTLLLNGDEDPWVRPEEARALYEGLRGPRTLQLFGGVGHVSLLRARPEEWKQGVAAFLDGTIERQGGGAAALSQ